MVDSVYSLLKENGPGLSSEFIAAMVDQGVSEAAARQRLVRASGEFTKLAGLRFTKNARFLYLDDQYGGQDFWDAIERAFKSAGQSYWGAVTGLRARGGRCLKSHFPVVCGAPVARNRQLSPERILDRLSAIQLLEEVTDEISGETFIQFHPYSYNKLPESVIKATILAEFVAMQAIRDWSRRIGFGSYGKFLMRTDPELPIVSGVAWDLSAPSYMRPLVSARGGKLKPGFFVCDINLNGPLNEDFVALFVRKHDMASAPANVAPIMPMLIGEVFTDTAFDLARQKGIAATTVSNLLGQEVARALRDLIELLSDAGATAAVNADHLYSVMNALTKIEGTANNLRGALFELAIGNLVKDIEGGYLTVGEKKRELYSGRSAEIDILLDRGDDDSVLVLECKSKIPGASVSITEVQKWYLDRVPLIQKILSEDYRYRGRELEFQIWSNGPFHEDAKSWLQQQETELEGASIAWKDGAALKIYARKANSSAIRKTLREHYFLHPLARRAAAAS